MILPVASSSRPSSHCSEARAVKALTTVALVKAMHTAAICKSLIANEGDAWTYLGRRASMTRAITQDITPCRAILPSPTLDIDRRTYAPWIRALTMPMEPISLPFCTFDQSNTDKFQSNHSFNYTRQKNLRSNVKKVKVNSTPENKTRKKKCTLPSVFSNSILFVREVAGMVWFLSLLPFLDDASSFPDILVPRVSGRA